MAETFDSNALAGSFSNEDDSDWNEKKRKHLKKTKVRKLQEACGDSEEQRALWPKGHIYAQMLRLSAGWGKTMSEHRNIGITELSKKVNKTWKGTSKEKKEEWHCKVEDTRKEYENAMKEYKRVHSESSKRDKSKKKKSKDGKEINTFQGLIFQVILKAAKWGLQGNSPCPVMTTF